VKDTKGSLCAKNQDTADCLASFFRSVYVNDTAQTIIPISAGSRSKNALQDIDFPISAIKEELQRLKDSSSPGPDGIGCKVLKANAETSTPSFLLFVLEVRTSVHLEASFGVPNFQKG
jgi:hypothetical protein